ncbi:MAG: hypothetical protein U0W40_17380 [Acidimicrobiia bacterium]
MVVSLAALAALALVAAPSAGAQSGWPGAPGHGADHSGPGFTPHQGENGESDVNVCSYAVEPGSAHCNARVRTDAVAQSLAATADASPAVVAPGSGAYGPADLQSAYGAPTDAGAGRTVAIVDAYDNPNAEADLAAYRGAYGLPECSTANGCFRKVDQNGGTAYPAANAGWATEISLDLQMVSAVCPKCNILLVEAASNSFGNLGTAVNRAATMGAVAISNSYGGGEFSGETTYGASYYNHPGIAVTVSSGDAGYGVEYPAASQYVTAVGGTSLRPASGGGWAETAWSGAGSGCSGYEPKPAWQTDTGCARRSVADVSAVADPATGVWVYDTYGGSGWAVYGGTSASAPIIGAVYGMAGAANPADYVAKYAYANRGALHDVTAGSNGSCGGGYLCTALAGYDGPTGLGTPNGVAAFAPGAPVTPVADFTVAASPTTVSVTKGTSGSSTLTLASLNGFNAPVALKATVSPATGLTATVPSSVTVNGTATAALGLQATTPGTYTVTVTATSGATVHTANVTVTVPTPDFTVTASPTTRSVTRGSTTTYAVTITRVNGFAGAVTLSVSGLQTKDAVSYSANPLGPATTTVTMTVKTVTTDAKGSRTLTITGVSGSLSRNTKVTLTYN